MKNHLRRLEMQNELGEDPFQRSSPSPVSVYTLADQHWITPAEAE
jgi:hypothetical protein